MKKNSLLKNLKKDLKDKREYKKALYFLFLFIVFFICFYLVLSEILYVYINYFFGYLSSWILENLFRVSNIFIFDSINKFSLIVIPKIKDPIIISFLCTGILEFCLLSSAIFASKGIDLFKRFYGFLIAIPLVIFFNLFRITLTTYIITIANLGLAEFMHGFLFRIFLVIIVVGFYYFWFKNSYK